ncbi:MAG: ABC transporter permease [Deltaproteobacteria bacterium]|jgi:peptide/nickel transport system permease protein|nr:ABC transporter permease [Deltaproteobacteria bacterium]
MTIKSSLSWAGRFAITLLGVSFLTFTLTSLIPGDPAEAMLSAMGNSPPPEVLAKARADLGLDKPFLERYLSWLSRAVRMDFGVSYFSKNTVLEDLADKFPATLKLAVLSLSLTVVISSITGLASAVRKGGVLDAVVRGISFTGISLPSFLVGLLLLYVVSLKFQLLPVVSRTASGKALILPVATLTFAMSVKYTRQVRNLVLEELGKDYVLGARARGLSETRILVFHVLPNVLLPLVTLLGLSFGSLLGGTALVEVIFSWPGLGNHAIASITRRDYPVVQAYVLWLSSVYMFINLAVDVSYRLLDPRVRAGREAS